ncbi:hypothetical protein E2C01_032324 [Portunus trituberculatus]|uniref:Uncharacterized protein n=1 Tax=Portunus trituberculatus TaxID=210409 RepID=A0A5B7F0M6_PORTR|nr:hypothetical protein [Portunus trituberculatus]
MTRKAIRLMSLRTEVVAARRPRCTRLTSALSHSDLSLDPPHPPHSEYDKDANTRLKKGSCLNLKQLDFVVP